MRWIVRCPTAGFAAWAIVVLSATPALARSDASRLTGFAAHYRPGLMEQVSRVRGLQIVPCMVASPHYRIGVWLTIESSKFKQKLECRVTDVPQPAHRKRLIQRKIVAELNFESAKILCGIKRLREAPPTACPVVVTTLEE